MRVHHLGVAVLVATVAALLAASGFARSSAPGFNNPVKITNTSCHLSYASASSKYTTYRVRHHEHLIVSHGFDIAG